jgi:hypothetical protein
VRIKPLAFDGGVAHTPIYSYSVSKSQTRSGYVVYYWQAQSEGDFFEDLYPTFDEAVQAVWVHHSSLVMECLDGDDVASLNESGV